MFGGVLLGVPLVLVAVVVNPNRSLVPLVLYAALIVATVVAALVRVRRTRIEYGDGRYRTVTLTRTREFTASDIRAVHTFSALRQGRIPRPALLIEGVDGGRLLRMTGYLWETEQLTALARDLADHDVPLVVTHMPVSISEVRSRYPRLVTWIEANPALAAGLVVLAIPVLFLVLLRLGAFSSGSPGLFT